jgi:hypothetical protein
MVPKVRKFSTGVTGQGNSKPAVAPTPNKVPDLSEEAIVRITASAPVKIRPGRGNPRKRRYKQKTYSLLQVDIDLIERLVAHIRQAGLYERSRSDIVRAGIQLLHSLPLEEQIKAVNAVENLKANELK